MIQSITDYFIKQSLDNLDFSINIKELNEIKEHFINFRFNPLKKMLLEFNLF